MQVFIIIFINDFISINSCFLCESHDELCQSKQNNQKNQKTQVYLILYFHEETTISVTRKITIPKSSFEPIHPPFKSYLLYYKASKHNKIQGQLKYIKVRFMNTKNWVTFSLFHSTVTLATIYLQLRWWNEAAFVPKCLPFPDLVKKKKKLKTARSKYFSVIVRKTHWLKTSYISALLLINERKQHISIMTVCVIWGTIKSEHCYERPR